MRRISTRDLRNTPGEVRELLEEDDLLLTARGEPVAYMIGMKGEDPQEVAAMVRQARAQRAVSRMRRQAAERGLDGLSPEEIEEEIRRARDRRTVP